MALVILEVHEQSGGLIDTRLVRNDKFSDDLAWRPRVNDICAAPIWKGERTLEQVVEQSRDELGLPNRADGRFALRHCDDTRVAASCQRVGKARNVVETIAREIAVVDEKNIHGGALINR